jgi:hypothetical protein
MSSLRPRRSRFIPLAAVTVAASLLAALGVIHVVGQSDQIVPGYDLPAIIDEVGAKLEPPPQGADGAALPRLKAIDLAAAAAGGLADRENPLSAQLIRYTNMNRGTVDGAGVSVPDVRERLVWLVRFTGTPQPLYGPPGAVAGPPASELNVVLDAVSGDVIEMFSYR